MDNYQKIATIIIRITGLTFMLSAILDIGVVVTGILLISLEIIPRDALTHEIYFLSGIFFFIGGVILYARSQSLAKSLVEALPDDKEPAAEDEDAD